MKSHRLFWGALFAVLLFAIAVLAQTTLPGGVAPPLPIPTPLQQTFTTGMMGFAAGQVARLSVLNLNQVPANTNTGTTTAQPANCTVALEFYDNKGGQVSNYVVPDFAPGQTTYFDLPYSSLATESLVHAEIRGVVAINPAPTIVESPAPLGNCSVITTLDIFDSNTGSTVAFTGDTRPVGGSFFIPVAIGGVRQ